MTKPQAKKRSPNAAANTKNMAQKRNFERWLLPGLLTIALGLITALVAALLIERLGGLTPEASAFTTALYLITLGLAGWWLIESARWIIVTIERRAVTKSKSKKK